MYIKACIKHAFGMPFLMFIFLINCKITNTYHLIWLTIVLIDKHYYKHYYKITINITIVLIDKHFVFDTHFVLMIRADLLICVKPGN